jgi:hypothetical protein
MPIRRNLEPLRFKEEIDEWHYLADYYKELLRIRFDEEKYVMDAQFCLTLPGFVLTLASLN